MNKKSGTSKDAADKLVKGIKRKTRKQYSGKEKIRILLAGLRGEKSIAALCRREGISASLYYTWPKEFLEAGQQRLAGDTARQATSPEITELSSEATALKEVIHKFGPSGIMNSDQGRQVTSFRWTDRLRQACVRISMDGKGRFLDNIFIERLWWTLKYECVYLHAWGTGSDAKAGVRKWMTFYNHQRPDSALGRKPPAVVYWPRKNETQPDQRVQRVA